MTKKKHRQQPKAARKKPNKAGVKTTPTTAANGNGHRAVLPAPPGLPATLTTAQVCWLLDVTNQHVGRWAAAGILEKVTRDTFSIASIPAAIRRFRDRSEAPSKWNDARTSLAEKRAQMARLDRLSKQGKLVDLDEITAAFGKMITTARTVLLSLPAKNAHRLATENKPAIIQEILREDMCSALAILSADDARPTS